MTPLDKAQALLATSPLPDNAEEQLNALADEAGEEFEAEFDLLFEALFVAKNQE